MQRNFIELLKILKYNNARPYVENGVLKLDIKKGNLTNELGQLIKNHKQELIDYLTQKEKTIIEIPKAPEAQCYPLSSSQWRLWVLNQFEENSVLFNLPSRCVLNGDYEIESLKRAIFATIKKHEILRTIFKNDKNGKVKQWILSLEELKFEIGLEDYRNEENKESKVDLWIESDCKMPFILDKGPLIRVRLFRLTNEEFVFYYNMHHIITDGWSVEVLSKDVLSFYEAFVNEMPPKRSELKIQYKDYAVWQQEQLLNSQFKNHQKYWLDKLSGELPNINLPSHKTRPKIKTNKGRGLGIFLSSEVVDKLNSFCKENGGSLFMGLLASWNLLMHRYTAQKDIIIGTPVSGREHADLEDQIGFYINTLALRNEINPEESFEQLFNGVKENTLKSFNHQIYPFDRLVKELGFQVDPSRSVVFDIMLILQNSGEKLEGIKIPEEKLNEILDLGDRSSRFDISLNFKEIGDYLSLDLVYNSDVYQKSMIERLITHFKQLLKVILKNPKEKISKINYLSENEKNELLVTFNETKTLNPQNKTVVDLFEDQVINTPNNIAVVFEDTNLTYQELNEKSNQLAFYLRSNYNIIAGDIIGIKLERSLEMIVSVLGVLKSGAAFLPIDIAYPKERINYLLEDSRCKLLIDKNELDKIKSQLGNLDNRNIQRGNCLNKLAYVIYTSGTTGRPKGVMCEYEGLSNYILYKIGLLKITKEDKALQFCSFSFDAFISELFTSLLAGAELHLVSLDVIHSPDKMMSFLDKSRITVATLPPAFQVQFKDQIDRIKTINSAGESLNIAVTKYLNSKGVKVINGYGPTENTIGISMSDCPLLPNDQVTIGRPMPNVQVLILDEYQNIVPIGVQGEICVSGIQLARGYLNCPELTAQKFINSPFANNGRLYKTGDLGKWLPDGSIEFNGRKDNQVKIRGYRIELGEIEMAILQIKEIEGATVLVKENKANDKELVAYIISNKEQNVTKLRSYLKKNLPEYMLPAYYVQLDAFPKTTNGKIDKKALPDPESLGLESGVEYLAPRNKAEEMLVKIWEKVLNVKKIGINDDFFALGGNSISLVRIANQYQSIVTKQIPIQPFYENSLLREHAAIINDFKQSSAKEELIELNHISKENKNMILIPPVSGHAIIFNQLAKNIEHEINCFGIDYHSNHGFNTVEEMSENYVSLITSNKFDKDEELILLGYSMGGAIAFEIIKKLEELNYLCKLISLDHFPIVGNEIRDFYFSLSKQELDDVLSNIVEALYGKVSDKEIDQMKLTLKQNSEILSNHNTKGMVKAEIMCVEALLESSSSSFGLWDKYTSSRYVHKTLEASHYGIFNPIYSKSLCEFILEFALDGNCVENQPYFEESQS